MTVFCLKQIELKNESFTSAFTAPVEKSKDVEKGKAKSEEYEEEEPQKELWTGGTSSPGPSAKRRLDPDGSFRFLFPFPSCD